MTEGPKIGEELICTKEYQFFYPNKSYSLMIKKGEPFIVTRITRDYEYHHIKWHIHKKGMNLEFRLSELNKYLNLR